MFDSGWYWKEKLDASHSQGGLRTVQIVYAAPCIYWQWYTVVKNVRKANKQMNRRQWNKGNCKLYHMMEKTSQNTEEGKLELC